MISAPEGNKKIQISIAAIASMVTLAFYIGTSWATISDLKEFTDAEVSGLRSDWDRDRIAQEEVIKQLQERVRQLELDAQQ